MTARRFDYDEWQQTKRERGFAERARLGARRGPIAQRRDRDEEMSLIMLDLARLRAAQASGEWKRIDARSIVIRL
ncbi:MAG: hypothetical protein H0X45_05830 [Planctomycetes bacterium]|nr:hypothetical protein [Planctomycetota bacterium]